MTYYLFVFSKKLKPIFDDSVEPKNGIQKYKYPTNYIWSIMSYIVNQYFTYVLINIRHRKYHFVFFFYHKEFRSLLHKYKLQTSHILVHIFHSNQ